MRYEAKFTPTEEDAMTGYRMFKRQPDDFLKLCAFGGILAVVVFGIASYFLHTFVIGVTGIFVGGGTFGIMWLSEWNARRHLKKSKPEELKFYFTEDGVEFSSSSQQWKYRWDELTKSLLDKRGVLLDVSSESFYVFIPAGAFVGGYPFVSNKLVAQAFPRLSVGDVKRLPIAAVDMKNHTDKSRHDKLVLLVDKLLGLIPKLRAATAESEKATLQNAVTATDQQIDALIYELYGLTEEEIRLVEGG